MNFARLKMVVILALFANVTMPMNPFSLHLPESPKSFMERNKMEILCVQNTVASYIFVWHLAKFIGLRIHNAWFGTELIPTNKGVNWTMVSTILSTSLVAMSVFADMLSPACNSPSINNVINGLLAVSTMGHMSNLIYNDALKEIKKNFKKLPPELTIKNRLDITTLDNRRCVICYDDELNKEYVNPCEQEDHIFCKQCLNSCFAQQKEKPSFKNKNSFFCYACIKEVPFNDEKFEIELPSEPQVTFGLWAKQVGFAAIFYTMHFFLLMSMLQC